MGKEKNEHIPCYLKFVNKLFHFSLVIHFWPIFVAIKVCTNKKKNIVSDLTRAIKTLFPL